MKILITTGPSAVPIDEMRVLTNISSGQTGTALSHYFSQRGHEVICLRGKGARAELPPKGVLTQEFKDNDHLLELLKDLSMRFSADAILHSAALSDFVLDYITDAEGRRIVAKKIPSRINGIRLVLKPAPKILPQLPHLWPSARIVGWKYELDGDHDSAVAAAIQQVRDSQTHFVVVNGTAYGRGFGICNAERQLDHAPDLLVLAQRLENHLSTPLKK
ncbi:MAG: phosphopantothenoylcysteine synthase [Methylacidiphilales bacterium]|nr:phosphopantothenoylcysteine synthase [Candidatus Methylacidiphilales bacterium]MDW8348727.1 phosphopantothenoylcysteine decarboxylase [Verrucomicrobiae bacterium]